ncbi:hypothetical protein COL8621_02589 [Actibacterium lipolyticum]|uniref:Uncharacterized protein n=2 Tax=Actibacterium lipolyticum TaxID=1524263 RepID=A0A238KRC3_9RHOB|nr:hypothetical protein COL8621_02589 [Actibacterium lipolyticum]
MGISQFGWVSNKGTSGSLRVVCPLIREHHDDDISRVFVQGMDPECAEAQENETCSPAITCNISISNRFGDPVSGSPHGFTLKRIDEANNGNSLVARAGIGGGRTNLSVPKATSSGGFFTYNVFCQIPPGQRITGLLLAEE